MEQHSNRDRQAKIDGEPEGPEISVGCGHQNIRKRK
jgi:hypothetical protein